MLHARKSTGMAMMMALLLSQTIALADESSSTTIKTETPLGTSSTTEMKTESGGASVVKTDAGIGVADRSTTMQSQVGPNGASVSTQKREVRANEDGSITKSKESQSHAVNVFGDEAHSKTKSSTTLSPDGTKTKVKEEHSWNR